MNTYTFNLFLQDGEIVAECITANNRKEAEHIAYDYYDNLVSIELIQVN